jgi:tRNA dimethylallyltransferase
VVGGTGLYLRALLEGLFPGPQRSEELRERLREHARAKGSQHLHRVLQRLDRKAADKIHANDLPKLIRAIEVSLGAKQPISEQWAMGRDALQGFKVLRIGLDPDRTLLYERLNKRVVKMFEAGLIDETKHLLERYGQSAGPLGSIGYKQVVQFLRGEIGRDAAIVLAQQAHRNYAKRQMTWFRREPDVNWLPGFGNEAESLEQAIGLVEKQL